MVKSNILIIIVFCSVITRQAIQWPSISFRITR